MALSVDESQSIYWTIQRALFEHDNVRVKSLLDTHGTQWFDKCNDGQLVYSCIVSSNITGLALFVEALQLYPRQNVDKNLADILHCAFMLHFVRGVRYIIEDVGLKHAVYQPVLAIHVYDPRKPWPFSIKPSKDSVDWIFHLMTVHYKIDHPVSTHGSVSAILIEREKLANNMASVTNRLCAFTGRIPKDEWDDVTKRWMGKSKPTTTTWFSRLPNDCLRMISRKLIDIDDDLPFISCDVCAIAGVTDGQRMLLHSKFCKDDPK